MNQCQPCQPNLLLIFLVISCLLNLSYLTSCTAIPQESIIQRVEPLNYLPPLSPLGCWHWALLCCQICTLFRRRYRNDCWFQTRSRRQFRRSSCPTRRGYLVSGCASRVSCAWFVSVWFCCASRYPHKKSEWYCWTFTSFLTFEQRSSVQINTGHWSWNFTTNKSAICEPVFNKFELFTQLICRGMEGCQQTYYGHGYGLVAHQALAERHPWEEEIRASKCALRKKYDFRTRVQWITRFVFLAANVQSASNGSFKSTHGPSVSRKGNFS